VRTASTRASLTIATVIASTAEANAIIPARPVFSVSPRTTTPSTAPTTGCDICRVGMDAVKGPARNADWLHTMPPSAAATQAYSSGVVVTAHAPPPIRATTPLVSTAKTPHSDPDTKANKLAATVPPRTRPATTHANSSGPSTTATAIQVAQGALERPACGWPTVTIAVTAAVSSPAQAHSAPVTARCDDLALIGSANSTESMSSACTSSTEPWLNAAACNAMLAPSRTAPHHQR
jgi:hypothetical protein